MILIDLVFTDQLKPTTQRNEDCIDYMIGIKLHFIKTARRSWDSALCESVQGSLLYSKIIISSEVRHSSPILNSLFSFKLIQPVNRILIFRI